MYISSRHKQQTLANCDHDISICDSKIQLSSVEKHFGVTISNTLCWDAHIEQLIKKCNSYLFLLSRIKVFLSRRNSILFYNSYILPHLDFCCIIWGNCSSTLEDKLVKFQKRAARVILVITILGFNLLTGFILTTHYVHIGYLEIGIHDCIIVSKGQLLEACYNACSLL